MLLQEMVITKNKTGSSKPCYLIYDMIQFEVCFLTTPIVYCVWTCLLVGYLQSSTEVALCDHNVRMDSVSKEVVEPRDKVVS